MFRKIASILLTGALAFSLLTAPIAHGAAEVYFSTDFSQVNGGSDFGFDNPQPDEAYFTPDTNVSPYEGSGPVGKLISTYTGGGYFYRHIPDPKISVTDTGLILEIKVFVTDTAVKVPLFNLVDRTGGNFDTNSIITLEDGSVTINGGQPATYEANKWYHFFVTITADQMATVYMNGEKIGDSFQIPSKNIEKIRSELQLNASEKLYITDFSGCTYDTAFSLTSTNLSSENELEYGTSRLILDFDSILDANSLNSIVVGKNYEQLTNGYTLSLEPNDHSRVYLDIEDIEPGATYMLSFPSLKDALGRSLGTSGEMRFAAESQPAGPILLSTTPENGASGVSITPRVSLSFDKVLDAQTVSAETITASYNAQFNASLSADRKTMNIEFAHPLLAGTEYTLHFDGVQGSNGVPAAIDDFTFTTQETPDEAEYQYLFTQWPSASATQGNLKITLENIYGYVSQEDAAGYWIGQLDDRNGATEGRITYQLDSGISSFQADFFLNDNNDSRADLIFEESSDGQSWTTIENVTDTENGLTSDSGKGHFYTVDSLNENSRFVRITLSKTKANAWGTRMYQAFICSDGNAPTQLIETDTQDAALSDELILKFNNQLYQPEISADDFSITSAGGSIAVAAIEFTDQYRGLKLKLDNILEANTQYTISYSSLVDIYNQAAEGSVEVQTGAAPSVSVESMTLPKTALLLMQQRQEPISHSLL